jgi:hypothetical protein
MTTACLPNARQRGIVNVGLFAALPTEREILLCSASYTGAGHVFEVGLVGLVGEPAVLLHKKR